MARHIQKKESFKVTKKEIVERGLKNRCPNCGEKTLFRKGLNLHRRCPVCGMFFERGEGFFLGSMSINYGVTVFAVLTPILLVAFAGWISVPFAIGLAVVTALLFPILFYRTSRSWWLMAYFYFLPHELPANRPINQPDHPDLDDEVM